MSRQPVPQNGKTNQAITKAEFHFPPWWRKFLLSLNLGLLFPCLWAIRDVFFWLGEGTVEKAEQNYE
jgi:hypothetical protein